MFAPADFPLTVLAVTFLVLWISAWLGVAVAGRRAAGERAREDYNLVLAAALTLLGLIIGFTFSMAVNRYDLRRSSEEAEADAIGTGIVRADLLPPADAAKLRELIGSYLQQRILFYDTDDRQRLAQIGAQTTQLQGQMWSVARNGALAQPNVLTALAVSGVNDVLSSAGRTQAAWSNGIPGEAWVLMGMIAVVCNVMIGYAASQVKRRWFLAVMPLVLAIAFFLIADIDSPRGGLIHLKPRNLLSVASTLRPP